ncbi:hypothetical protein OROGR_010215 [Orobanche gracilis]
MCFLRVVLSWSYGSSSILRQQFKLRRNTQILRVNYSFWCWLGYPITVETVSLCYYGLYGDVGVTHTSEQVAGRARDMLDSWLEAKQMRTHASPTAPRVPVTHKWLKPPEGTLKYCNVDAAIFSEYNQYGIGVCIRSSTGDFIGGKTMWFDGIPTPQEGEAIGLKETILWLEVLGLTSVSIELDCAPVVNGLELDPIPNTEFGAILMYCRNHLSSFPSFKVSYIRRQANLVAHTLARASRLYARSHTFDLIPTCIETIVLNEMH